MHVNLIVTFLIGISIFLLKKNNFLFFLVSLELLFLAINLQWIQFSIILNDNRGAAVSLVLIALAAIDAAIGLSLLLKYFSVSLSGKIQMSQIINLKG
jgi:NADH-quinone oxidoreductase subunit K